LRPVTKERKYVKEKELRPVTKERKYGKERYIKRMHFIQRIFSFSTFLKHSPPHTPSPRET